ncbi:MAG: hypothetical protein PF961_20215, partial [Planctomycetota bacterium]|nr:hypothetical protein [Planctomycetota bacterium]
MKHLILALLCCSLSIAAAEDQAAEVLEGPEAPAAVASLLTELGAADDALLSSDAEGLWWQDGELRFNVTGLDDTGSVAVLTPIGSIAVARELITQANAEALSAFATRVALAEKAEIQADTNGPLIFGDSVLTGLRIRGQDILVLADGVLRIDKEAKADRSADLEALEVAQTALMDGLADSGYERLAQKSIAEVLRPLTAVESGFEEGDETTPTFARRVVRHGWLQEIFADDPKALALTQAVKAASAFKPALAYHGDDLQLVRMADAFGTGGWVLVSPSLTRIAVAPPLPMYHWGAQRSLRKTLVVIDLPSGTSAEDAITLAVTPVAAAWYQGKTQLAAWTTDGGLVSDLDIWRRVVPASGHPLDDDIAQGYMPPHIPLITLAGDVYGVVTAGGILRTPVDGSKEAGEAFLEQAAAMLPDAPTLDLIGQYIFKYTYDSPDSRTPFLLGSKDVNSDIHQTALQTLSTTTGGMCRGDCDDLSELYQDILARQGTIGHVISLPAHAAFAWAEQREEVWHVFVMQTGGTLEFSNERLQDALAAAYKHFDASDTFDPNGLGLLLRFSGENTRSSWRLSYRIFSEPDYAKTMIDVQRDWHYQTYMEGIRKMEALIASGDDDTANYRELAGLFSFTGQYQKAAEYLAEAIKRTDEPDSRLFESAELLQHLLRAEQDDEAQAVLIDMLENQLPPLQEKLGAATVQLGLQIVGSLLDGEDYD